MCCVHTHLINTCFYVVLDLLDLSCVCVSLNVWLFAGNVAKSAVWWTALSPLLLALFHGSTYSVGAARISCVFGSFSGQFFFPSALLFPSPSFPPGPFPCSTLVIRLLPKPLNARLLFPFSFLLLLSLYSHLHSHSHIIYLVRLLLPLSALLLPALAPPPFS